MNHSRKLNSRINNLQERSLRIAYNDYRSSFDELLQKDNSITVHVRNLRTLVTEGYKTKYNLNPQIMNEVFKLQNPILGTVENSSRKFQKLSCTELKLFHIWDPKYGNLFLQILKMLKIL